MSIIDLRNIPITINGSPYGTASSKDPLVISVTDGVDLVNPDSVTLTSSNIEIQVPTAVSRSTATLMKTGQTTSYRTGDDGDLEAGRGASFLVLAENNPFGNTNRFTDELGGQVYTNNWVIDWSTYYGSSVLGYFRIQNGININWDNAINNALGVFGTFSGCRLPNINELRNIINYSVNGFNYYPFNYTNYGIRLWSSTSLNAASSFAWCANITYGLIEYQAKTNITDSRYIPVRTFTVTGTTLT